MEIPDGHIPVGVVKLGDKDFTDHVFVTPSIHYAKLYAFPGQEQPDGSSIMFVLKVRVRPRSYTKQPETVGFRASVPILRRFRFWNPALISKEGFRNEEIEWLVHHSRDVVVTSLLVKVITPEDSAHLREQLWA